MEEEITIPLNTYHALKQDSLLLNILINAGVDNWEGYDVAIETYQNYEES